MDKHIQKHLPTHDTHNFWKKIYTIYIQTEENIKNVYIYNIYRRVHNTHKNTQIYVHLDYIHNTARKFT